jgi:predicted SnoaL-like aldol condensation-catalyzing enzyme
MSTEANKALVRRLFEELLPAATLPAEIENVIAPDFVDHDPTDPAHARGVASIRATHAFLHRTYGKVWFHIDEIIAEGDLVALRWSAGPARASAWFRVRDGKVIERWAVISRAAEPAR